jgi:hypothetical protein
MESHARKLGCDFDQFVPIRAPSLVCPLAFETREIRGYYLCTTETVRFYCFKGNPRLQFAALVS